MVSSNIGVSRLIDDHYHDNPEKFVRGLHRVGIATPLDLDIPRCRQAEHPHPQQRLEQLVTYCTGMDVYWL